MNQSPNAIYYCKLCDKWYRRGSLKCLVNHPEGQCCHYGDTLLTIEPTWKAFLRIEGVS